MARYLIFGRSGSGKSWFFGWVLEGIIDDFDYVVHFDIEDEERGLSESGKAKLKTFYVDEQFANQQVKYRDRIMSKVEAVILHNKKVRIIPDGLKPSEQQDVFAEICGLAMEIGKTDRNFHISADEAHQVLPEVNEGQMDDRVVRALTGGRKKGVEWAFSTQRPAKLYDDAFTQANWGIYFSLTKDNDIAKVNNSIGINAYQSLPKLQPREFIQEDLDSGEVRRGNTNELDREYEHYASDDGVADQRLEAASDGEPLHDISEEEIDPDEI